MQIHRRCNAADGADAERRLESQIENLRSELDAMIGELDRRRHEALDIRLQLRRHGRLVVAIGAGAAVLMMAAAVVWGSSRRRQHRLLERMENLAWALDLMSRHPSQLQRALEE
jgi:prefoldin subunit 5